MLRRIIANVRLCLAAVGENGFPTMHWYLRQFSTSGCNIYEVLRALDTLELTLFYRVATSAGWIYGEDVIVQPKFSNDAAQVIKKKV